MFSSRTSISLELLNMSSTAEKKSVQRKEIRLFLFLVVCLFPLLSVMLVGGYGVSAP